MREGRIKDYTQFAGLGNPKDEGGTGKVVGGMGLGRKVQNLFVGIPIKHPSGMLSRQVDVRDEKSKGRAGREIQLWELTAFKVTGLDEMTKEMSVDREEI